MGYVGILLAAILIWLIYEWIEHTMTEYNSTTVECQKLLPDETIKLCLIADLHNNKKNLVKVCGQLKKFAPDLILIPGDMVNKHSRLQTNAIRFLEEIQRIAPVYYSFGNHEERIRSELPERWEDYRCRLPHGVKLLDNSSVTEIVRGRTICISGLSLPEEFYGKGKLYNKLEKMPKLQRTADFHILLAHHPEYAEWYANYQPDFVVSGHLHGGLLRLPFFGGIVSPRLRIPKEDAGAYEHSFGTLFITRGLGSHTVPLRFFNRTELNLIVLCGENKIEDGES